jgi:hypothetical protein
MPDDTTPGGLCDKGSAVAAEVLKEEGAKRR